MLEFLNSSNLEILNQGNDPTDCSARSLEVIDITLGFFGLLESFKSWEVSFEPSLSDLRHILFTLDDPVPVRLKGTIWDSFQEGLKAVLESGPEMNMNDEAGLGLAILSVQQALNSAYEDNRPLKPVRTGKHSRKWTYELQCLRKEVRRLFNKRRADKTLQGWALYTEAQRRYRKEVREASKDAWRTFCNSGNDLPMSARLHRALSRDPNIKM